MTATLTSRLERRLMGGLLGGVVMVLLNGCASVDSKNTSARPWGQPSDRELRENWWHNAEWSACPFCPWQTFEQQRYEEYRHPGH